MKRGAQLREIHCLNSGRIRQYLAILTREPKLISRLKARAWKVLDQLMGRLIQS